MNELVASVALGAFAIFLMLFGADIALEDRGELGKGLILIACGLVLMFHLGTG